MYYNKDSKEFGLSEMVVRKRHPNVSLPKNFKEFENYVFYESTAPKRFDPLKEQIKETYPVLIKGVWYQSWEVSLLPDEQIQSNLQAEKVKMKSKVSQIRESRISLGFDFEFNSVKGVVQTRNQNDISNINNLVMTANILKLQNKDSEKLFFRDEQNVVHELSLDQVFSLGISLQNHLSSLHDWSWNKKKEIDSVQDLDQLRQIVLE